MTAESLNRPDELHAGDVIDGRYRIDALLGSGGMASVYRATHLTLEQAVAIKVISPQIRALPGIARRFLREARAATQLTSPHVVRVFDVGIIGNVEGGAPYMVMEYLEGKDLSDMLYEKGPLDASDAVDVVLQACEALAEVHGLGIVHRDLKPANLFVTRGTDGRQTVKLIDFGISRMEAVKGASLSVTQPEQVMGSPKYMSPEQMESAAKVDARTDIWGAGVVLYELLTGETPFDGDSYWDIYLAAKKGTLKPASTTREGIPEGLDAIIAKCLHAERSERYRDVAELAEALAPFAGEEGPARAIAVSRILEAARMRVQDAPLPATKAPATTGSFVRRRVVRSDPPAAPEPKKPMSAWSFGLTFLVAAATTVLVAAFARPWLTSASAASAPTLAADPPASLDRLAPLDSSAVPPARPSLVLSAHRPAAAPPAMAPAANMPNEPPHGAEPVFTMSTAELPQATAEPPRPQLPPPPPVVHDERKLFEDRK